MVTVGSNPSSGGIESEPVSISVVHTVATAADVDPMSLPPLYETIDPDALNDVAACGPVGVSFEYAGYDIYVERRNGIALVSLGG